MSEQKINFDNCPISCFEHKYKINNNYKLSLIIKKHFIIILILLSILFLFLYFSIKYREVYLEFIILLLLGSISFYIGYLRPENIRYKSVNNTP